MSLPVLRIRNVVKTYKQATIHYPPIDITKRITLLVGPNGSGKSTLLKAILHLVRYQGTIQGMVTCSYMPEQPHFPKDITVDKFLSTITTKPYHDVLVQFHLEHKQYNDIATLSKGMLGKLNFIQAYLHDTDMILLDEPTEGLDVTSLYQLLDLIKTTNRYIVITTHNPSFFQEVVDEVIPID